MSVNDTGVESERIGLRVTQDDREVRSSFLTPKTKKEQEEELQNKPRTANDVALEDIAETASRLGIDTSNTAPKPRPIPKRIDVASVDPFQAWIGSVGAGVMFVVFWSILNYLMKYYEVHPDPFESSVYVVQRISAVMRTVLLTVFSLMSGITGITTGGLFILGIKSMSARYSIKSESHIESKPENK
eukprot:CAMPEP_0182443276 /NCGR_PEP_ID=MMETSP1172-20130603/2049_1 /TAXON_ID=708627 /ORGANISM="Timspurckia oligopyrenoides, Strain CCMP3278" /LENGTH=186 /DNA_ID=CAMNT_0024638497 /DNA_START=192 /DNA_END=752 /DNA_ORIENTATION=-